MEFAYSRFCQFPFAAILSPRRCPVVKTKIPCYTAGYILTPGDGNPLGKLTLVQQPNKKKALWTVFGRQFPPWQHIEITQKILNLCPMSCVIYFNQMFLLL